MVGTDIVCVAVEGRFLQAPDATALRAAARRAEAEGADAVFLSDGPLGDAVVLAAGLSADTGHILLGVRVGPTSEAQRHPTIVAREMTTLDHLSGGRAVLAFTAPFTGAVSEAITLCRAMWRQGVAASEGPHYPVAGAINRPTPISADSPLIALDLTDGATVPPALVELVDLLLTPAADPGACHMQRP
jgi:alkanesulfonate monooxygenase SsuD/methylene tetrahydromethanopterin reductase-like flavin-dependent oxidoreductase (luciferase family)